MKAVVNFPLALSSVLLFAVAGCELEHNQPVTPDDPDSKLLSTYSQYAPARIDIMPLTEFVGSEGGDEASRIKVLVSVFDAFDSQIKSPSTFRFELYEYLPRSAESKGKRIIIWRPDAGLTDAAENNKYWRDFLRAYEFNLPFKPEKNQTYVLQATALCPNGKRLSADFILKYK
jgi:hypothetical protein